ncbi:hypothetical protein B4U79_16272 [Dinothrombium tinctorium]|uniref:Major facilitator superfamily (MFS) profile domain-containing protein n=1 Tax=Dinothrombium tinctorium TaxID=1965070 RepID=A0A443RS41_9ACAR|nr:hypothetical protein B4U79_16272 [Dinothrombium tinctorium]
MHKVDFSANPPRLFVHYKRRYVIAILLGLFTATNFYQNYEYSAIADVVSKCFKVDVSDVNWTALLYNIGSVLAVYPTLKCIERFGFRISFIVASFANALGSCVKCLAVKNGLYGVLLLGQLFPASLTLFAMSLPAILGANWFKSDRVVIVIGINSAFGACGSVAAFLAPSLIFDQIGILESWFELFSTSVAIATFTSIVFAISVLIVQDKPPSPPSLAAVSRPRNSTDESISILLKNRNYFLLLITYSLVIGMLQVTLVILNQSILAQFVNGNRVVTIAGTLTIISGIPSSLVTAFLCEKCKRYRLLLNIFCFLVILFFTLYTIGLWLKIVPIIYLFIFFTGFTYVSLTVLLVDYIVEVTYPYPESRTLNIVFCVARIPGLIFIPISSLLIKHCGSTQANFLIIGIALFNFLISFMVTNDLRRHRINLKRDILSALN